MVVEGRGEGEQFLIRVIYDERDFKLDLRYLLRVTCTQTLVWQIVACKKI